MPEEQYYALLARAAQGSLTRHEMKWHLSLAEGWAAIHAGGLLHGEAFIWPDARLSGAGRKLIAAQELRDKIRQGLWQPQIEL